MVIDFGSDSEVFDSFYIRVIKRNDKLLTVIINGTLETFGLVSLQEEIFRNTVFDIAFLARFVLFRQQLKSVHRRVGDSLDCDNAVMYKIIAEAELTRVARGGVELFVNGLFGLSIGLGQYLLARHALHYRQVDLP